MPTIHIQTTGPSQEAVLIGNLNIPIADIRLTAYSVTNNGNVLGTTGVWVELPFLSTGVHTSTGPSSSAIFLPTIPDQQGIVSHHPIDIVLYDKFIPTRFTIPVYDDAAAPAGANMRVDLWFDFVPEF